MNENENPIPKIDIADIDPDKMQQGYAADMCQFDNWFPALQRSGVNVPKTIIVPLSAEARRDLFNALDGNEIGPKGLEFITEVRIACGKIGTPAFLRNSMMSNKHDWERSCYITKDSNIKNHIINILEMNAMAFGAAQPVSYVVREMLNVKPYFHAFHGNMPVTKERRYFLLDGYVCCHHPYWPKEAIQDQTDYEHWEKALTGMNIRDPHEIKLLTKLTEQVGRYFKGYWSVDWLQTVDGEWHCIDMAEGWKSYHWNTCTDRPQGPGPLFINEPEALKEPWKPLKTTTIYFDLEMHMKCPHCGHRMDPEDDDMDEDHSYLSLFRNWLNNADADILNLKAYQETCPECKKEFRINKIER